MRFHLISVAILALTAPVVSQTTWYVDVSAPAGGSGSAGAPFTSIQAGVDAAVAGDTVLVAPGTYVGSVTIAKDITVRSTQGPDVTLSGYSAAGCAMTISSTSSACVVDGFTLTGCHGSTSFPSGGPAGGLVIYNSSAIVRRCIIRGNFGASATYLFPHGPGTAAGPGGVGVHNGFATGTPVIENCVITGNIGGTGIFAFSVITGTFSTLGGPGGLFSSFGPVLLRHCTITGNMGGSGGGGFYPGRGGVAGTTSTTLVDCIVWGNTPGTGAATGGMPYPTPSEEEIGSVVPAFPPFLNLYPPIATWCDIRGGYPGAGNFDANPLFVNPGTDYRLSTGSPCVDRGTLAGVFGDIDYVWRPQYLNVDVGAYEWRPPAALSLTIAQPGGPSWAAIGTAGGGAGEFYINLITADPENGGPYAGQGPWGGLWIPPEEMLFQVGLGAPPFVGVLDANGTAATGIWLPPGLTGVVIYAISHTIGGTLVNRRSSVLAYTFL